MTDSFRTKLWIWFAAFAAIILSLLWILQTVFLQRFYDSMMIGNIRSAAEEIIQNSEKEDLDDLIDELSVEDSLLVYITDEDEAKAKGLRHLAKEAYDTGKIDLAENLYKNLIDILTRSNFWDVIMLRKFCQSFIIVFIFFFITCLS